MTTARGKARWSTLDMAASFAFSAFWHLLVLAVFTLAIHPFQIPDQTQAIDLELLPPLTPPAPVVVKLRPRQAEEPREVARPEPQLLPKLQEVKPQPAAPARELLDVARPSQPELEKPLEVERRAVQAQKLQTERATPQIPEAPPTPVEVARPAPALQQPLEIPRTQAAGRAPQLQGTRAVPQIPAAPAPSPAAASPAAPSQAPVQAPAQAQIPVLTNESVIQAPVEIRPRDRTPIVSGVTTSGGGAPDIPAAGGSSGGTPPAGGAAGGGGGARPFDGRINGGFDAGGLKGMRMTLGCENPDTYKLTPEERAACLQRFGRDAKNAADLGINIPAAKQAEYDRQVACHRVYSSAAIPASGSDSGGTSVRGLGANPSLKACGPGDR